MNLIFSSLKVISAALRQPGGDSNAALCFPPSAVQHNGVTTVLVTHHHNAYTAALLI
ncbi:hypothetical protein [Venatoribacter cucullus]|uniref:hypothetical protein n=1 Tax=Venatoribacter cucullus TaxID=2661630 RepID=UPI00223FE48D|nr:hypothetical protein [Venatoribacter cucullus]